MIIQSKRVWIADGFMPAQIEISGKKIKRIMKYGTVSVDNDFGNNRIVPGFIDIHTHGAYGFDTNDGTQEGLLTWAKRLPIEEGVTSFLPTTITHSNSVLKQALSNVAKTVKEGYAGAEILGVHLEGPFIDTKYKGAQPEVYIRDADVEEFKELQYAAKGLIRYVTLAPEHDNDYALIRWCSENGVIVSMGHSSATFEQARLAIANGAKSMTHVYNAMSKYGHKELGLVGAAFRFRNVYGEIICDGIHSSLDALNNFYEIKGRDYAVMVSDSLRPKGLMKGDYYSGGEKVYIDNEGAARLVSSGDLAGSTLKINKGLQLLVEQGGVPFDAALNSCTKNPASLLGEFPRKGQVAVGSDADLVVLYDNYDINKAIVRGHYA